jgi:hypothetical protein
VFIGVRLGRQNVDAKVAFKVGYSTISELIGSAMKQKVGTFNGTDKEREKKDKTWGPWKTWHGLGLYASWFLSTSPHCYNCYFSAVVHVKVNQIKRDMVD